MSKVINILSDEDISISINQNGVSDQQVISLLSENELLEDNIFGESQPAVFSVPKGPTKFKENDISVIELGSESFNITANESNRNGNVSVIEMSDISLIKHQLPSSPSHFAINSKNPHLRDLTSEISEDSIEIMGLSEKSIPEFLDILKRQQERKTENEEQERQNLNRLLEINEKDLNHSDVSNTSVIEPPEQPIIVPDKIDRGIMLTELELDAKYERSKRTNLKYLQQVNKKKNKDEIMADMKLSVSSKADEYLTSLNEEYSKVLKPLTRDIFQSDLPIIKFKRYVRAIYNHNKMSFVPVDPHWVEEDIIVVILEMIELVRLLPNHGLRNLLRQLKIERPDRKVIIFANNHDKFLNTLRTKMNRKYNELTTRYLNGNVDDEITPKKRKRKQAKKDEFLNVKPEHVSIQIKKYEAKGFTFQKVVGLIQISDWLASYAYSIGKRVYDQFELNRDVAHLGNEKSGDGSMDTFKKMLTSFPRLTERKAQMIMRDNDLNTVWKMHGHFQSGEQMSSQLKGVLQSDVVKSLYKFFTTDNESELI